MSLNIETNFYVLQNSEGKFFRRKGYGGSGETWVDTLDTARVWVKLSGARSQVTYFANTFPKYPAPKILKLTVTATEVLDETERLEKARLKKEKAKQIQALRAAKQRFKDAEADLQRAKARYDKERKLQGKQ